MIAPIEVQLSSGVLTLELHQATLPLDELCTFATRQNPKRAFLFVSKVLGKHIPVSVKKAREIYQQLVEKMPTNLLGTIAWVGMAETATGFAEKLAWCWAKQTKRADGFFQITTRYPLFNVPYRCFEEKHSHATFQAIHLPELIQSDIQTLVLVDDEITTGQTLVQLMNVYKQHCPCLKKVIWMVLKSWMAPELEKNYIQCTKQLGIDLEIIALIKGSYSFKAHTDVEMKWPEDTVNTHAVPTTVKRPDWGMDQLRQGILIQPERPKSTIVGIDLADQSQMQTQPNPMSEARIVGFGECNTAAFLLAEHLEEWGVAATVQSITRSPILEGDTIQFKQNWRDPYGSEVPHYSYNIDPAACKRLHVVSECRYVELPEQWKHAWLWQWTGNQFIHIPNPIR